MNVKVLPHLTSQSETVTLMLRCHSVKAGMRKEGRKRFWDLFRLLNLFFFSLTAVHSGRHGESSVQAFLARTGIANGACPCADWLSTVPGTANREI